MIKVGNKQIEVKHFPDGTQLLNGWNLYDWETNTGYYDIFWRYEHDEELITIIYLVNHIRKEFKDAKIALKMPYIPNARMDRVKNDDEVFTLKWFCNIINSLGFDKVFVLDPHSDVSVALLNNVRVLTPVKYIEMTFLDMRNSAHITDKKDIVIYFPDAGAYKRYKDLTCFSPLFTKVYGQKVRDWNTGKIVGLDIVDENHKSLEPGALKGKYVLMIDDIISYGGTMYYSALKLHELGAENIFAYATHVEPESLWSEDNGTFKKVLGYNNSDEKAIVEKLYTTDSIYKYGDGAKVKVFKI